MNLSKKSDFDSEGSKSLLSLDITELSFRDSLILIWNMQLLKVTNYYLQAKYSLYDTIPIINKNFVVDNILALQKSSIDLQSRQKELQDIISQDVFVIDVSKIIHPTFWKNYYQLLLSSENQFNFSFFQKDYTQSLLQMNGKFLSERDLYVSSKKLKISLASLYVDVEKSLQNYHDLYQEILLQKRALLQVRAEVTDVIQKCKQELEVLIKECQDLLLQKSPRIALNKIKIFYLRFTTNLKQKFFLLLSNKYKRILSLKMYFTNPDYKKSLTACLVIMKNLNFSILDEKIQILEKILDNNISLPTLVNNLHVIEECVVLVTTPLSHLFVLSYFDSLRELGQLSYIIKTAPNTKSIDFSTFNVVDFYETMYWQKECIKFIKRFTSKMEELQDSYELFDTLLYNKLIQELNNYFALFYDCSNKKLEELPKDYLPYYNFQQIIQFLKNKDPYKANDSNRDEVDFSLVHCHIEHNSYIVNKDTELSLVTIQIVPSTVLVKISYQRSTVPPIIYNVTAAMDVVQFNNIIDLLSKKINMRNNDKSLLPIVDDNHTKKCNVITVLDNAQQPLSIIARAEIAPDSMILKIVSVKQVLMIESPSLIKADSLLSQITDLNSTIVSKLEVSNSPND